MISCQWCYREFFSELIKIHKITHVPIIPFKRGGTPIF